MTDEVRKKVNNALLFVEIANSKAHDATRTDDDGSIAASLRDAAFEAEIFARIAREAADLLCPQHA